MLGRKHQLFKTISEENYDTDSGKKSYFFSDYFSVTQLNLTVNTGKSH
jgi:hypothetical protein